MMSAQFSEFWTLPPPPSPCHYQIHAISSFGHFPLSGDVIYGCFRRVLSRNLFFLHCSSAVQATQPATAPTTPASTSSMAPGTAAAATPAAAATTVAAAGGTTAAADTAADTTTEQELFLCPLLGATKYPTTTFCTVVVVDRFTNAMQRANSAAHVYNISPSTCPPRA